MHRHVVWGTSSACLCFAVVRPVGFDFCSMRSSTLPVCCLPWTGRRAALHPSFKVFEQEIPPSPWGHVQPALALPRAAAGKHCGVHHRPGRVVNPGNMESGEWELHRHVTFTTACAQARSRSIPCLTVYPCGVNSALPLAIVILAQHRQLDCRLTIQHPSSWQTAVTLAAAPIQRPHATGAFHGSTRFHGATPSHHLLSTQDMEPFN